MSENTADTKTVATAAAAAVAPCKSDYLFAPRFIVHLDAPPRKRWQTMVHAFRDQFVYAREYLESVFGTTTLGKSLQTVVDSLLGQLTKGRWVCFSEELAAIATDSGLSLGNVVMLQLAYEAAACCTSVVTTDATTSRPLAGRTMDWEARFLQRMTAIVDFRRNNQTVFVASTWAGYVGVLTGQRPGAFSVSINFRRCGDSMWSNLKQALSSAWPIGFLVRVVCDRQTDFQHAVDVLATAPLIAPCFITVAGVNAGEGIVLSRTRNAHEYPWRMSVDGPCVQTNRDHWVPDRDEKSPDILYSRRRGNLARAQLSFFHNARSISSASATASVAAAALVVPAASTNKDVVKTSVDEMWALLNAYPICNDETVYATVMDVYRGTMDTRIPTHGLPVTNWPDFYHCSHAKSGWSEKEPVVYTCGSCHSSFLEVTNQTGECMHTGTWHSSFAHCDWLSCGFHLGPLRIGYAHWSCCFSTVASQRLCHKSGAHRVTSTA